MSIKYTFKTTPNGVKLTVVARTLASKFTFEYQGATRAECVKQAVDKADVHASIVLS